MAIIREVECKSLLSKSKISEYTVNCYTGCLHGCVYCYARYMKRFTGHDEPWGHFVDAKVNAPFVLENEIRRGVQGRVFMSSVCDGWQPLERKYQLSRVCLDILLHYGFHVSILTKSSLIRRDFDLLEGTDVDLGFTLTAMENSLCRKIEPEASLTKERIMALKEAESKGIRTWAFLGPFMPFLSDTEENIDALFKALSELKLGNILVDQLNARPGVWKSIKSFLGENYPYLIGSYGRIMYDEKERQKYGQALKELVMAKAGKYGLSEKVNAVF